MPAPAPCPNVPRARPAWRRALATVAVAAACTLLAPLAAAEMTKESDVKAALLYNFTQFAEWPPAAFAQPGAPLVIGILGHDPFGDVLDKLVEHETVNGHRIVIERFHTPEAARHAHVLFISSTERTRLPQILSALGDRPILTVADFDGFVARGGMVAFRRGPNHKIRLSVNLDAARAVSLTLSAKLLRVVEIVTPDMDR